jgi:hypothetical protein
MSLTVVKNKVNRPNACFTTLCQSTDFDDQSTFCTHSLQSNASNIQRSLRNECFPVDSNVKIAKNTGPLRHLKKNLS